MEPNDGQREIRRTFMSKGRLWVSIENPTGAVRMPKAHYVWLKYNPAFAYVPKGYIIHHLDLDELNEDPSNLVLMHRFHHIAFHWKHKNVETNIEFDENIRQLYFPSKPPRVYFSQRAKKYYVQFYQRINNEPRKSLKIFRDSEGEPMFQEEHAREYAKKIWDIAEEIRSQERM